MTFDPTLYARRIREYRKRLVLTQDQLAGELVSLSVRLHDVACGANDRLVRAWERGEKRPGPYYQRLLCELFDAAPAGLGFRAPLPGEVEPGPAASLAGAEDDDDVKRRRFLAMLGAAALEPLDAQLEGVRRGVELALARVPSSRDVEDWERTAVAYSYELGAASTAPLLANLLVDFDELRELLAAPCAPPLRRRLTRVAGQLAALTAITVVGLGQHYAARRWWRTARRAADEVGDAELAAYVRGHNAVMSLYGGHRPAQVLELADEAVAAGGGRPCKGVINGLAARAQARAIMGDRAAAREALGDVAAMFERLPDAGEDATGSPPWAEDKLRHGESYVHTHLGDTRRAVEAQDRALALYATDTYYRGPNQVRLHRATCLILDGEVTEGVRYATDTLAALSDEQRDDRFVQAIAHTAAAAVPDRARSLPPVREYRELLALPAGPTS